MENHYFLMGKSIISVAMFNSFVKLPEGLHHKTKLLKLQTNLPILWAHIATCLACAHLKIAGFPLELRTELADIVLGKGERIPIQQRFVDHFASS